jgi:hypothetical protein
LHCGAVEMETEANFLFCGEKEKSTAPDVTIRASREEEESVAMRKEEHAAPQRKRQVCFCGPAAVATKKKSIAKLLFAGGQQVS